MLNFLSNSGKFLSSPTSFLLIGLWITNDYIGKWQFHNELTGKISDITGLIVFPFLLTSLTFIFTEYVFPKKIREEIVFVLMNLSIVTLFFIINWNQNGTADKTDLLCIPLFGYDPLDDDWNAYFEKIIQAEKAKQNVKVNPN